jgi:hypothetical protein
MYRRPALLPGVPRMVRKVSSISAEIARSRQSSQLADGHIGQKGPRRKTLFDAVKAVVQL